MNQKEQNRPLFHFVHGILRDGHYSFSEFEEKLSSAISKSRLMNGRLSKSEEAYVVAALDRLNNGDVVFDQLDPIVLSPLNNYKQEDVVQTEKKETKKKEESVQSVEAIKPKRKKKKAKTQVVLTPQVEPEVEVVKLPEKRKVVSVSEVKAGIRKTVKGVDISPEHPESPGFGEISATIETMKAVKAKRKKMKKHSYSVETINFDGKYYIVLVAKGSLTHQAKRELKEMHFNCDGKGIWGRAALSSREQCSFALELKRRLNRVNVYTKR